MKEGKEMKQKMPKIILACIVTLITISLAMTVFLGVYFVPKIGNLIDSISQTTVDPAAQAILKNFKGDLEEFFTSTYSTKDNNFYLTPTKKVMDLATLAYNGDKNAVSAWRDITIILRSISITIDDKMPGSDLVVLNRDYPEKQILHLSDGDITYNAVK
jgi:hypothetical protein